MIKEKHSGKRISKQELIKRLVGTKSEYDHIELIGLDNILFYRTGKYDFVLEQGVKGLTKKQATSRKAIGDVCKIKTGDTIDLDLIRNITIDD